MVKRCSIQHLINLIAASSGDVNYQSVEEGLNRIDTNDDGYIDRSEVNNELGQPACAALSNSWSFPTLLRFREALEFVGMILVQDAFCGFRMGRNEHFVSAVVMDCFYKAFDSQPDIGVTNGTFLETNFLRQKEVRTRFIDHMKSKKFSTAQIYKYLKMFSQPGTIVIVEDNSIGKIMDNLSHERFHRELKKLSSADYKLMIKVAEKIKRIRVPLTPDEKIVKDRIFNELGKEFGDRAEKRREQIYAKYLLSGLILIGSPEEVYCYTAADPKYRHAEPYIQRISARAYALYMKIKARVLDLEKYDSNLPPVTVDIK